MPVKVPKPKPHSDTKIPRKITVDGASRWFLVPSRGRKRGKRWQ